MLIYLTLRPKCQAIFLVELVATLAERGAPVRRRLPRNLRLVLVKCGLRAYFFAEATGTMMWA